LRLRFGLDGEPPKTLEEVGAAVPGDARARAAAAEHGADKMRKAMQRLEHQNTAEEAEEEQREQQRQEVFAEYYRARQFEGAASAK